MRTALAETPDRLLWSPQDKYPERTHLSLRMVSHSAAETWVLKAKVLVAGTWGSDQVLVRVLTCCATSDVYLPSSEPRCISPLHGGNNLTLTALLSRDPESRKHQTQLC